MHVSTVKHPKSTTRVAATLPHHEIVYVGFDLKDAEAYHHHYSDSTLTKTRVTGSRLTDPRPWHYEVVAY